MKKQIDVALVIQDINTGLGDVPIMEKYGLTPSEYVRVLEKLRNVQAIRDQDAAQRLSSVNRAAVGFQQRRVPRCYLALAIRTCDASRPEICGQVDNLTQKGFQAIGIEAQIDEKRDFTIHAEGIQDFVLPFSFQAVCKWTGRDSEAGEPVSGFQITQIGGRDLEQLKKLIDLAGICEVI